MMIAVGLVGGKISIRGSSMDVSDSSSSSGSNDTRSGTGWWDDQQ
jgi:hypothetical protein